MNWIKTFTKGLISLGSLAAFAGGWILFGHSGKPVANPSLTSSGSTAGSTNTTTLAGLEPLPTLAPLSGSGTSSTTTQSNTNNSGLTFQPLPSQPSFSFTGPTLRTRGS